jgi:hypothetical protein
MMRQQSADGAERSDKLVAILIATALHVVLIVFLIKMSGQAEAAPDAELRQAGDFTSEHRDMPIPPDGIAVDSLPLSGMRVGEAEQYEISLDCAYEVSRGSSQGVLRSGTPAAAGVLGCPPTIPLHDLAPPLAVSVHYDLRGSLLGVVKEQLEPNAFAAIEKLQLAKPRPGRQWQGGVLIRLRIDEAESR